MTARLYLVPVIRLTNPVYRIPKYLPHRLQTALSGLENVTWALDAYLFENYFLVVADTDATQDSILTGQSDVIGVPDNLDSTIPNTTARNIVRAKLEALYIPGQWVVVGMSYRTIIRVLRGVFHFRNRFAVLLGPEIFNAGLHLDSTVGQMSATVQNMLAVTAASLGLDYSAVTGATTVRQLLYGAGQQFTNQSFVIAGAGLEMVI